MAHRFKKQYGQNFLTQMRFARQLVDSLDISSEDTIIEVGPGDGMVTKLLLETGAQVIAIEVDYDLIVTLIKRFNWANNFELVHQDILTADISSILAEYADLAPSNQAGSYKVIGSLPYNISKQIIEKFITTGPRPTALSVLIQEEVAVNYASQPPKSSVWGAWLHQYADVKKLASVPKAQFYPRPKVNGAILHVVPYPLDSEQQQQIAQVTHLISLGFSQKRKTLWNNLKSSGVYTADTLETVWSALGLPSKVRAAELSKTQWRELADKLQKS